MIPFLVVAGLLGLLVGACVLLLLLVRGTNRVWRKCRSIRDDLEAPPDWQFCPMCGNHIPDLKNDGAAVKCAGCGTTVAMLVFPPGGLWLREGDKWPPEIPKEQP